MTLGLDPVIYIFVCCLDFLWRILHQKKIKNRKKSRTWKRENKKKRNRPGLCHMQEGCRNGRTHGQTYPDTTRLEYMTMYSLTGGDYIYGVCMIYTFQTQITQSHKQFKCFFVLLLQNLLLYCIFLGVLILFCLFVKEAKLRVSFK